MIKKWNIFYQKKTPVFSRKIPATFPFLIFLAISNPSFLVLKRPTSLFSTQRRKVRPSLYIGWTHGALAAWGMKTSPRIKYLEQGGNQRISLGMRKSVESVESRNGVETIEVDESWGRPGRIESFGTHREYPILTASSVRPLPRNISPVLHPQFPGHVWANGS